MQQTKRSIEIADIVEILVLFIGTWSLSPVIKNSINQMYPVFIAIFCLGLILFEYSYRLKTNVVLILLYVALAILYKILGISDDSWAVHSNSFLFFFTMIVSIYILEKFSEKKKKRDVIFLLVVFLINLLYQFYLYFTLNIVSLYHARDLLEEGIVVGTTSFVTDTMLVGMFSFVLCFLSVNRKIKIASILILILSIYYIYNIQTRATALIFIFLFIATCLALGFSQKISGARIVLFVSIFVIAFFIIPYAITSLANSENEYYSRKFEAINVFFSFDQYVSSRENQSSLQTRFFIAGISLKTWVSSTAIFLFGKGYDAGFYDTTGIGRHSELIDLLPRYGILGFSIAFAAFANYFTTLLVYLKSKRHYKFLFYTMIAYSIFNGIFLSDIGYIMFIIIPLVMIRIETNNEEIRHEYSVSDEH